MVHGRLMDDRNPQETPVNVLPFRSLCSGVRVNLIYNASAGTAHRAPSDELLQALRAQGFDVLYIPTKHEADLPQVLAFPADLIVVAGGDGSVRAVAGHLLKRSEPPPPLAIVPLGTSNNIGRTLGLTHMPPIATVHGLQQGIQRRFDVGRARGPWGERYFLESFGIGLLADLLRRYDPDAPKSVLRGVNAVTGALFHRQAISCRLEVDSEQQQLTCLLLEVANTPTISNGLRLAPHASPSSGELQLIWIEGTSLPSLTADIASVLTGHLEQQNNVHSRPARHLTLSWDGSPVHIDAEIWPAEQEASANGPVSALLEVLPGALTIHLPEGVQ